MAPKAKARVRGGGLRRPAAPPMRARGGEAGGARRRRRVNPEEADSWMEGRELSLHQVRLEHLQAGQILEISEAIYYGEKTKVCGKLQRVEMEGSHFHLVMALLGTTSEEILRVHSLDSREFFTIHRCPADCNQETTGDRYIHGLKARLVKDLSKEGWMRNLEKAVSDLPRGDDLAELRQRDRELNQTPVLKDGRKEDEKSSSPEVKDKKKKKEKKEKKEKRKKEKKVKKEKRKREDSESEDSSMERLNGRHPLLASVKKLRSLFAGTGLDGRERVRRRVNHRARKFLKKGRKEKSSSSQSSSSSETSSHPEEDLRDGVFTETSKAKAVAERYPGVLAQEALQTMGDQLLHERGENVGSSNVKPTAFPYYRQQLAKRLSGPASREAATLAMTMDFLMKGRPSHAMDVLAQRLKSIEASAGGSHWQVCQRMEIVPQDQTQIARPVELRGAQKETYEEARTQWLSTLAPGGKGKGKGQDGKFDRKGGGKRDGKDGKDGGKQKGDKKEK